MIAPVDQVAGPPVLPEGVTLREVASRADFDRIAGLEEAVWGDDRAGSPKASRPSWRPIPDALAIVVAEAGGERRLCRLDPFEGGHGVRDALGRRDPEGLAGAGDLPGDGRIPRDPGRRPRLPLPRGRRVRATAVRSWSGSASSR